MAQDAHGRRVHPSPRGTMCAGGQDAGSAALRQRYWALAQDGDDSGSGSDGDNVGEVCNPPQQSIGCAARALTGWARHGRRGPGTGRRCAARAGRSTRRGPRSVISLLGPSSSRAAAERRVRARPRRGAPLSLSACPPGRDVVEVFRRLPEDVAYLLHRCRPRTRARTRILWLRLRLLAVLVLCARVRATRKPVCVCVCVCCARWAGCPMTCGASSIRENFA